MVDLSGAKCSFLAWLLPPAFQIPAYGVSIIFGFKNVGIACVVPLADSKIRVEI
jgi:hypothetical protein